MNTTIQWYRGHLRSLVLTLLLVLLTGLSGSIPAQVVGEPCGDGEVISNCQERILSSVPSTPVPSLDADTAARSTTTKTIADATKNLNLLDLSTFGAGALRPFLETFLAGINGISTSGDGEELTITYNAPNQKASGEAILHKVEVSDAVLGKYAEDQRDEKKEALKKGLDDLSDVEAKLVFNFCNGRKGLGRNIGAYTEEFTTLVNEAVDPARPVYSDRRAVLSDWNRIKDLTVGAKKVRDATWLEIKQSGDAALRLEVEKMLAQSSYLKDAHEQFKKDVKESQITKFYELVANQPQMYIEVGGRIREEAIGPDTWAAKYVWEIPQGRNVNKLVDYCRDHAFGKLNLACYKQYMGLAGTSASLRSKDRWKLELVASGISSYEFRDPKSNEVLLESGSDVKATLAGAYGRVLRYVDVKDATTGEIRNVEGSRFDAELAGEYVDNEELFQRRLRATITLTNRINDEFDAALSFVWASEPEFRGDVDKEFSARAGLRFKVGQTGNSGG